LEQHETDLIAETLAMTEKPRRRGSPLSTSTITHQRVLTVDNGIGVYELFQM